MWDSLKNRLLLSIIKLASLGQVRIHQLMEETGISLDTIEGFLNELVRVNYIRIEDELIEISPEQRVNLAILAIKEGIDVERVSRVLGWKEFEDLGVSVLDYSGFEARKHFRFKSTERRYEIDILALKPQLILSVDCKHWQRSWQRAATIKAVEAQTDRTRALIQLLPNLKSRLKIKDWERLEIMPLIITLSATPLKTFQKVPIVPIYNFRNFLNEIQTHKDEMEIFIVKV